MTKMLDKEEGLASNIAEQIASQIILGSLVEGERIQELKLARELNVSRGTVREALLILQRSHLIYIYPRRGAMVAEISAQQVKDLFEAFSMLQSLLSQRYSVLWRESDYAFRQTILLQLKTALKQMSVNDFYDTLFLFFNHMVNVINSQYTRQIYDQLSPGVKRCYYLVLNIPRIELEESFQLINQLLKAIDLRKQTLAAQAMDAFVAHLCQLVLTSFMRMKQIELAWAKRSRKGVY